MPLCGSVAVRAGGVFDRLPPLREGALDRTGDRGQPKTILMAIEPMALRSNALPSKPIAGLGSRPFSAARIPPA
jgi:hypothetical protein